MNDTTHVRLLAGEPLLGETADRLFGERCSPETVRRAEDLGWIDELWQHVAGTGLAWVGAPTDDGGGSLLDAAEVLHRCGRFAVPLPVAETGVLGGWLLHVGGLAAPDGPVTVPVPHPDDEIELDRRDGSWYVRGRLHRVPWASAAERLVLVATGADGTELVVSLEPPGQIVPARNLAGEPRDVVTLDDSLPSDAVAAVPPGTRAQLWERGALTRALLIAGALERSAELAAAYAQERRQFGQTIARFQAVQHHLVLAAEHAAAASMAAWLAAAALIDGLDHGEKLAIARTIGDESVRTVTARCHQVFGAIGMTKEHELHLRTRRAWSWTGEWGSGRYWAGRLGEALADDGADRLWPNLAAGPVRS